MRTSPGCSWSSLLGSLGVAKISSAPSPSTSPISISCTKVLGVRSISSTRQSSSGCTIAITPWSWVAITSSGLPSPSTSPCSTSRRRSNLPPKRGFQWVSAVHAPSSNRQVRRSAWLPPMVRMPSPQGIALWKTLLSGSSSTTGVQPATVSRMMMSFAGPGTDVFLPSAPAPSTNCACATSSAGYGPPVSVSRRGAAAAGAGGAAGGAVVTGGADAAPVSCRWSSPPQATTRARTQRGNARTIVASSLAAERLSTNGRDRLMAPTAPGRDTSAGCGTPGGHAGRRTRRTPYRRRWWRGRWSP